MASTNQSPAYINAQGKFLTAKTSEEKIEALEEMIKECPKHKSSEKMLANLKTRLKKLLNEKEKSKKLRKGKKGIKKEDMQAVIIGLKNSGKSSLLKKLTNIKYSLENKTTIEPIIGMIPFAGMQIQIIENPSINLEYYDKGLTNSADLLLIVIRKLDEIEKINSLLHSQTKKIFIYNYSDGEDVRKIEATLKSKRLDFFLVNLEKDQDLYPLKELIFKSFGKIRVFTKEPGKQKSEKPIVLPPGSTVFHVAEKIFHGFSKQVREARITGPSSKFPNQKVGLKHILKDMDVVEFKTR